MTVHELRPSIVGEIRRLEGECYIVMAVMVTDEGDLHLFTNECAVDEGATALEAARELLLDDSTPPAA